MNGPYTGKNRVSLYIFKKHLGMVKSKYGWKLQKKKTKYIFTLEDKIFQQKKILNFFKLDPSILNKIGWNNTLARPPSYQFTYKHNLRRNNRNWENSFCCLSIWRVLGWQTLPVINAIHLIIMSDYHGK